MANSCCQGKDAGVISHHQHALAFGGVVGIIRLEGAGTIISLMVNIIPCMYCSLSLGQRVDGRLHS